jgi:transposase
LEAGPLSQWLYSALAEADLPVICVETRHMRAALKAQINKTDRNDARGIAQMMRAGLYRPVHVKTLRSQKLRTLLTHRKLLQSKAISIENELRGTLRNFGLKVGVVGAARFEARIKELAENCADLAALVEPLLVVRRTLGRHIEVRRRDDAGDALRSRPDPAGALSEMVLAQGLGDADRQAPRHEEGNRRAGTSLGRRHASHLG